jgi:hypothetical protein
MLTLELLINLRAHSLLIHAREFDQEYRKLVSLTLSEWLSIHERARGLGLNNYLILVRL